MINTFESVKVLKVGKVDSLATNFKPASGKSFHVFIAPKAGSELAPGDVVVISAKPVKNDSAVEVPIVVGDWNPTLLEFITAGAVDLTTDDVFYSEVDNY